MRFGCPDFSFLQPSRANPSRRHNAQGGGDDQERPGEAALRHHMLLSRRCVVTSRPHAPCRVQDALVQVCGGEEMADRATKLWDDIKTKNRLDVSDQKLSDDDVKCLIKGLHMCDACHACPRDERAWTRPS